MVVITYNELSSVLDEGFELQHFLKTQNVKNVEFSEIWAEKICRSNLPHSNWEVNAEAQQMIKLTWKFDEFHTRFVYFLFKAFITRWLVLITINDNEWFVKACLQLLGISWRQFRPHVSISGLCCPSRSSYPNNLIHLTHWQPPPPFSLTRDPKVGNFPPFVSGLWQCALHILVLIF